MTRRHLAPRRFVLDRFEDESGVSGTGMVAWGVQFPDGRCVTRWCADASGVSQTCIWESIRHIERIHGHHGKTRIRWLDGALEVTPDPPVGATTLQLWTHHHGRRFDYWQRALPDAGVLVVVRSSGGWLWMHRGPETTRVTAGSETFYAYVLNQSGTEPSSGAAMRAADRHIEEIIS